LTEVDNLKEGQTVYMHTVRLSRTVISDEEGTVLVESLTDKFSDKQLEEVWDRANGALSDDGDVDERDHEHEIINTTKRIHSYRCTKTRDMFTPASTSSEEPRSGDTSK